MSLDVNTLFTVMLANVFAMSLAVPVVMGWRISPAARCVMASSVAQAAAWGCFLLARPVHDRLFSTLWVGLLGVSFVFMSRAVEGWLGPRPGRLLLLALAVLTPIGYGLGFDSYPWRVGWANFGLAGLMLVVCLACAWPAPQASRRWRGLVIVSLGLLALITAARGVLGAFFTAQYPELRAPHVINVAGAMLNHIALTLTTIGLLAGWHEEAERALRRQADTDGLTGLFNRRAWQERADLAFANARRYGEPLSVLMIDIDHFKRINDQGGHEAGDRALQLIGERLRTSARHGDLVCRYGGEEFCVLLSHAGEAQAREVDRRLRGALEGALDGALAGALHAGTAQPVGFSSGLAVRGPDDETLDSLLRRADTALYAAKAAGRGRLEVAAAQAALVPAA
jgi:diguanylate cyclase (GGDEF)-like protein